MKSISPHWTTYSKISRKWLALKNKTWSRLLNSWRKLKSLRRNKTCSKARRKRTSSWLKNRLRITWKKSPNLKSRLKTSLRSSLKTLSNKKTAWNLRFQVTSRIKRRKLCSWCKRKRPDCLRKSFKNLRRNTNRFENCLISKDLNSKRVKNSENWCRKTKETRNSKLHTLRERISWSKWCPTTKG